jgi:acetyl-CoA carboxylase biotin carboxyl carrier protein
VTERLADTDPEGWADRTGPDLAALTEEILPALIARLRASRLGELEIRSDTWRVRLRRDQRTPRRPSRTASGDAPGPQGEAGPWPVEACAPAVGYFSPHRGLVVGQAVLAGDVLGSVDVLGVDQEVMAPIGGIVSAVLAERGQAVEYGQPLVEIDPLTDDEVSATVERADADHDDAPPAAPRGGSADVPAGAA